MSDRMTPIPFGILMKWILEDMKKDKGVFGVRFPYKADGAALNFLGEKIETPFGPPRGRTPSWRRISSPPISPDRAFLN